MTTRFAWGLTEVESLLAGAPSLFQTPHWLRALERAYPRFRFGAFRLERDGEVSSALPVAEARPSGFREWVSLPFGTHGGPVFRGEPSRDEAVALFTAFQERVRGPRTARYELVVLDPAPPVAGALRDVFGDGVGEDAVRVLDLTPGARALWDAYPGSLRTRVRRAREAGVRVESLPATPEAIARFYPPYQRLSRDWDLSWRHARETLDVLAQSLGTSARVWVGVVGNRVVTTELMLYDRDATAHTWLCGALPESRDLYARHLLLHTVVETAAREGFREVYFGASGGNPGVDDFKRGFGGTPRPLLRAFHQAGWVDWVQRVRW